MAAFIRALGAQLEVVAEHSELLLTPGENVEIVRLLEDPPTAVGAAGLRVTLPDLVLGDELNLVAELRVRAPREPGPMRALGATLTGKFAGTSREFKEVSQVEVLVTRTGSLDSDPVAHATGSLRDLAPDRRQDGQHSGHVNVGNRQITDFGKGIAP